MGRELRTIHRDEDNIRQLVRFPHFVEFTAESCQPCLMRIFTQEVFGDGDVADFSNPCCTQEIWVIP